MPILNEPKYMTTTIRVSPTEREQFHELAERLGKRSAGAAVRAVVKLAVQILREQQENESLVAN